MLRIEDIFGRLDLMTEGELREALKVIDAALWLSSSAIETLRACHHEGPLMDGDVPSKKARDELMECGAVSKVVVGKEPGYNACTQFGREVLSVSKVLL